MSEEHHRHHVSRDFVDWYGARLRSGIREKRWYGLFCLSFGIALSLGPWMLWGGAGVCGVLAIHTVIAIRRDRRVLAELEAPRAKLLR